jgi:hypothetical protein
MITEDFLDIIVNVQWGQTDVYRAIVLLEGQKGSAAYGEEFTPSYTEAQLNNLAKPIPVPVFGPFNPVATPTDSDNQTWSAGGQIINGNELVSFPPLARIDYHGYTLVNSFNTKRIGHNPFSIILTTVPPGPITNFDYKGKKTSKIPVFSKSAQQKGLPLTGAAGVYMKLSSPNPGLTKYNGTKVAWHIPGVDTAHYDPKSKLITAAFASTGKVKYYDLKGTLKNTVTIAGGVPEDISRNGNFYCLTSSTGTNFEGIQGYKPDGTLMWSIPGDSIDTGFEFGSIVAFGEDYIVVTAARVNPGVVVDITGGPIVAGTRTTTSTDYEYRAYHAKTGALAKQTAWGRDIDEVTDALYVGPIHIRTLNKPAYAILHTAERSAYWP